jgi:transcription termination/antitermination protein NusA
MKVGQPAFLFRRILYMATTLQSRSEFAAALNQVCNERGIDPKVVLETIKAAILAAYRKDFPEEFEGFEDTDELPYEVDIDADSGGTRIYKLNDGSRTDITPPGFGRIAAQTAKAGHLPAGSGSRKNGHYR